VTLALDPPGPNFPITEECAMPTIRVDAKLNGVPPVPDAAARYHWHITLIFTGQHCPHSLNRRIEHPVIDQTAAIESLVITFTAVRGGDLVVSLTVDVGKLVLTATSTGLHVTGTNPTIPSLLQMPLPSDGFKGLMRAESRLSQFIGPTLACPQFSSDNLGGVGICQLTRPPPSEDQVWNWKENVLGGIALYRQKEAGARAYLPAVRAHKFKNLAKAFNAVRAQQGLAPLAITLPDYTPEQLERDTVRGFNGYAGGLHEYRLKVVQVGGKETLFVNVDPTGTAWTAEWEEVPVASRPASGDPNYVNDVYAQPSF
jgi:hypothetical protein